MFADNKCYPYVRYAYPLTNYTPLCIVIVWSGGLAQARQTGSKSMNYQPYLDECDLHQDKLDYICALMAERGWVGVPIVVDGEQAITGSHRVTAARIVNRRWEAGDDVQRVDVPSVTLEELYDLAGLDFLATSEAEGKRCANEHEYYLAMVRALPVSILDEYRIELH